MATFSFTCQERVCGGSRGQDPLPDAAVLLPQNLLVQTPLQEVLAAILDRLRGQQTCILELQDQLGKERAAREVLQGKVDWVVKQTEDGKNDVTDEVVRSFEERLQDLSRTGAAAKQALASRIEALEAQLAEADNLGGHLGAVRDIAGILGMAIPQADSVRGSLAGDGGSGRQSRQATSSPLSQASSSQKQQQQQPMATRPASSQRMSASSNLGPIQEEFVPAATSNGGTRNGGSSSTVAGQTVQQEGAGARQLHEADAPEQDEEQEREAATEALDTTAQQGQRSTGRVLSSKLSLPCRTTSQGPAAPLLARRDPDGMPTTPSTQTPAGHRASGELDAAFDAPVAAGEEQAVPAAAAGEAGRAESAPAGAGQAPRAGSGRFMHLVSMAAQPVSAAAAAQLGEGAGLEGSVALPTAAAAGIAGAAATQGGSAGGWVLPGQADGEAAAGSEGHLTADSAGQDLPDASSSLRLLKHSKSDAMRKVADVVDMLRKKPGVLQNGLLWKLQASLRESVLEQERLKGEVEALRAQLELGQQSTTDGLQSCNEHIDAVEDKVAQVEAVVAVLRERDGSPTISFADLKVLEDKVNVMDTKVADNTGRIGLIEEQLMSREASATATELLTPDQDSLAVLQSHLLTQQNKLQKYMDSLAANIQNSVPGQVNSAVNATVLDISRSLERRLADRLASKQDIQALSIRVSSKITREEVERMLGKLRQALPQAHAPASGTRMKCISCDSDLQPVLFAAAPGSTQATADLRYSQLPSISPPRQPNTVPQPRPVSPTSAGLPSAQPSTAALGRSGATTPMRRTGHGAPVGWMHQMRRESNNSALGGRPTGTGDGSGGDFAGWEGGLLGGSGPAEEVRPSNDGQQLLLGLGEGHLRPYSGREGSGLLGAAGAAERRRTGAASTDGSVAQGGAGAVGGGGISSRSSKVALPALERTSQTGGGSPTKIRALMAPSPVPGSRSSLTGGAGSVPGLAAEASLTVQPVIPQPHPAPPPRAKRPQTSAPHKLAAPAAAHLAAIVADEADADAVAVVGIGPAVQDTGAAAKLQSQLPYAAAADPADASSLHDV